MSPPREPARGISVFGNDPSTCGAKPFLVYPIGVVRSSVKTLEQAPKQGVLEGTEAEIVVDPAFAGALAGLANRIGPVGEPAEEDSPHRKTGKIIVVCWMHLAERTALAVFPKGEESRPPRGVFSTRSPHRPNPLTLHTVELLKVDGLTLTVRGMDAIDGTPVVDIKPHSPGLDA